MIGPITPLSPPSLPTVVSPGAGQRFADSLSKLVGTVDESSGAANAAVENMLTGRGDVHEAMIALQKAETALQLTVQVRNKLVQAYQEIMRMPV